MSWQREFQRQARWYVSCVSNLTASIALLAAGAAAAQLPVVEPDAEAEVAGEAEPANVDSYPAAFFAELRPVTALDMVRRTPGFTYSPGKQDVRGLSGAGGNVLIDGQAQTSKSVALDEALQKIPASQVARIDLVRGGAGGIDMAGFAVVANVVRVSGAGSEGSAQIEPRLYTDGRPMDGEARLDWSRRASNLVVSGAALLSSARIDEDGVGRLVRSGPTGAILDAGRFTSDLGNDSAELNGAAEYRTGAMLYRSSVGYEHRRMTRDELADLAKPERFIVDETSDEGGLGINIERRFASGLTARLDASQTYEAESRQSGRVGGVATTDSTAGESNLRLTVTHRHSDWLGIEAGAEGAFNFLDQKSSLTTANANVRVEELRSQPFVTTNWQIAKLFALETGARYETSTISQTGDTNSERTFAFFKPRVIAVVDVSGTTQLRLRFEREVKQLNFNDFAASTGATDGAAAAGNATLQPERAWVSELAIEQRLWERSAIVLTYTHEKIAEVWDYEAVGLSTDGKGNVGDGTRDIIQADIKIALDSLGISGGRLEGNPQFYMTQVTDPFTGRERNISMPNGWRGRIGMYLDRPAISSTFALDYVFGFRDRTYRIDQLVASEQRSFTNLSWEWTPRPRLTVRLAANYIGGRQRDRNRDVYAGGRAAGILAYREERFVRHPMTLFLRVRKGF